MAFETAEFVGGPWDGRRMPVDRAASEATAEWRGSETVDACAARAGTLVMIALGHPTRHRYLRTGRRTAGGATVFRHAGRAAG